MNAETGSLGSVSTDGGIVCRSRSCASAYGTTTAASKIVNVLSSVPTTAYELPCSAITPPIPACSAAAKSGPITATCRSPGAYIRPRAITSSSRRIARACSGKPKISEGGPKRAFAFPLSYGTSTSGTAARTPSSAFSFA
jgi:hypothetical protein